MSELVWKSIGHYTPDKTRHYLFTDDFGNISLNVVLADATHFAEVILPDGAEEAWKNYQYRDTLKPREQFFKDGFRTGRAAR